MFERVKEISEGLRYSQHLGFRLVKAEEDHVTLCLPYGEHLGVERVNGGAISSLVDTAATCAFWSNDDLTKEHKGATLGFSINFMRLAVAKDLWAHATVRRRGGSICVGDVRVVDADYVEVAIANVTYKLNL